MKQWVGLGKFLAGHMQVIVPICVTLGVLFPQQIGVLKPIVPGPLRLYDVPRCAQQHLPPGR